MKKVILILFTLLFCSKSFAQEIIEQVKIGKYDEIIDHAYLPNQGFVLVTGSTLGGKHSVDVRYFAGDGKQRWTKSISAKFLYITTITDVVVSPNGENIYLIQMHANGYNDNKHYISHFNLNGDERKFEIKGREEFGKNLQTIFCDNNYLYYLATDNGNESSKIKKSSEKLILNRFNQRDFFYKRYVLDLPSVEGNEHNTFWSLIGQRENEKHLVSKSIDINKGENVFTVITFNSEGQTGKAKTFTTSLTDNKFTRPSLTQVNNPWESAKVNLDREYNDITSVRMPSGNTRDLSRITTDGAFGQILFSDLHNSFYIFGFYGPEPYRNENSIIEGFYVHKVDIDGKISWKLQEAIGNSKSKLVGKKFQLTPAISDNLIAVIGLSELPKPYLINSTNVSSSQFKFEGSKFKLKVYFTTKADLKSFAYIEKMNHRYDDELICFDNGLNGELLLRHDTKKSILEVRLFK